MNDFNYSDEVIRIIDEIQGLVDEGNFVNFIVIDGFDEYELGDFMFIHKYDGVLYDADNMKFSSIREIVDNIVKENKAVIEVDDGIKKAILYIEYSVEISPCEVNMDRLINIHKLTKNAITRFEMVPYGLCKYTIYDLIDVIQHLPTGAKSIILYNLHGEIDNFNGIAPLDNIIEFFDKENKINVCMRSINKKLINLSSKNHFIMQDYIDAMNSEYKLTSSQALEELELSHLVIYVFGAGIWIIKCKNKNIGPYINCNFWLTMEV